MDAETEAMMKRVGDHLGKYGVGFLRFRIDGVGTLHPKVVSDVLPPTDVFVQLRTAPVDVLTAAELAASEEYARRCFAVGVSHERQYPEAANMVEALAEFVLRLAAEVRERRIGEPAAKVG